VILCEGETFFVDEPGFTRVAPKSAMSPVPLVANLAEHEREMLEAHSANPKAVGVPTAPPLSWHSRQTLESKIRKLVSPVPLQGF